MKHPGLGCSLSFHVNEFSWNYTAKTIWIRDFFHFWAFQECSIQPGRDSSRDPAGSAPHLPADTSWILALGFLQCQAGGAALLPPHPCCSHRDGAGSPGKRHWHVQGWGRGGRGEKKSAEKMNQLLQGRLPELIPILLFPRRKAVAGKRGRKDFLLLMQEPSPVQPAG